MDTSEFNVQISFRKLGQMELAARALLDDEMDWSFTVIPSADSAVPSVLEIHDVLYTKNLLTLGRALSVADEDMNDTAPELLTESTQKRPYEETLSIKDVSERKLVKDGS